MSKRRLKPLILRDYLLDDLSSCSSNGFKSFPRRQCSSTVRCRLDAEIKQSGMFHHNLRLTCGLALIHAVQKASTALLSAVKLLPFPSSAISPLPSGKRDDKKGLFSRSFSRNFWKQPSRRKLIGRQVDDSEQEIQRWRTFADFLQESQDEPSDRISYISPTDSLVDEATISNAIGESSSGESETSNGNDAVEDATEEISSVVMKSGDCVGSRVRDNMEECVKEEKEQFSPISILECPFEDDAITPPSHQRETDEEEEVTRKSRRFESLVRLEPVDLEKRIEQYVVRQDYNSHMIETEEDQSEKRAKRLFALVKSRIIEEPNHLLASHKVDNVLLDFFKEDETRDEDKLVNIVEEWIMRRLEEDIMFMSWEVRDKREIYVKEMKWGGINGEEREYVVHELGNGLVTSLINELILDFSFSN